MYEELLCAGRTAHNLHTRNHHPALLQCTSQVEWHLLLAVVVVVLLLLLLLLTLPKLHHKWMLNRAHFFVQLHL